MAECRFMIKVKNQRVFHCAVFVHGWAELFMDDACIACPYKVKGKPIVVDKELKSGEFWEIAGKQIRAKDWEFLHKQGL
jgi:hypothetical protein